MGRTITMLMFSKDKKRCWLAEELEGKSCPLGKYSWSTNEAINSLCKTAVNLKFHLKLTKASNITGYKKF